jgi:anoctamin-10
MALANNFLELRSDAFKITVHSRRPIPTRTDTIGPWLSALTFLSWLSALTNASLVYLFRPAHLSLQSGSAHSPLISRASVDSDTRGLVISAALIALAASHGYFLLRMLVRHAVERVVWTESHEVLAWEKSEREVKVRYLDSVQDVMSGAAVVHGDDEDNDGDLAGSRRQGDEDDDGDDGDDTDRFWLQDEGLEEIQRIGKQA